MTAHALEQPVKSEVFRPLSLRRRITNDAATTFFVISFVGALVPLVWVLSVVVARGWYAVTRSGWWTHSLRGVLPEEFAGGVYHALYGTLPARSLRRKMMPVSGAAGRKVMPTRVPECNVTPRQ